MNRGQPRFVKAWWRRWRWALALVLAVVGWVIRPATQPVGRPVDGVYHVERIVDGDTLLLRSGQRVRLQGVDAPETVHPDQPVEQWGPEASAFTRRFVGDAGHQVELTFGAERVDRYGRWLAFVGHGDRMLNEELVRAGLAEARLDYRYAGRMKRRLQNAQAEARAAGRGMWSPAPVAANNAAGLSTP